MSTYRLMHRPICRPMPPIVHMIHPANFCRLQIYFVFFRLSLYIYCLVTRICGTKVANEKYVECFWSTKCNPLHKFSFDINETFSSCSVDKTERNSSGRAKGKDNEYTKVSISIQESVLGYNGTYAKGID